MRITLVQPPSNRYDTSELAPPLGLVSIAASVREDDIDVSLVDLNFEGLRDPALFEGDFFANATSMIAQTDPDVVGFTSMALESHVCLELARRLKIMDPVIKVVLGGPHFSASAKEMLERYNWIDFVVTGEGEIAMRDLLFKLRTGKPLTDIFNVAYLQRDEFRLQRKEKRFSTLNDLPFPAYDLVDLDAYFALNPYRVLDIENARGCALRCSFCYSSGHWGQGEQARSVDRVLEDVHRHYELGARHLFFVGDNFVNSKPYAKAVADAIASANPGITWRCYSTLPQMTEDVAESFAKSGCKYLFFGVDAVSDRSKREFQKSYFRGWHGLRNTLERCLDRGMTPTCAFMLSPPDSEDAVSDNEAALVMATHAYNVGAGVRLNPLTIYARTGIEFGRVGRAIAYSGTKPRMLLDGHPVIQENEFAKDHPELFPYHNTVGDPSKYDDFIGATHTGFTLLDHFPRTLMQAAHEGTALWPMLWETAGQVDYSEEKKATWRSQEAEAFVEVASRTCQSPEVADTLAFEIAEHRLRRGHPGIPVKIEVAGTPLDATLNPHAQLSLSRAPTEYETTECLEKNDKADSAGSFLLVGNGAGVRYLKASPAVDELLQSLQSAALDNSRIEVSAEGLTSLMTAKVVSVAEQSVSIN